MGVCRLADRGRRRSTTSGITAAATTLSQNQTINSLFYGLAATGTITLTGQTTDDR